MKLFSPFAKIIVILSSISSSGFSQDISNFTQFFINPYTLNPSYAGIEGRTALFVGYRKQWTSINGAPVIQNFSLHTPINKNLNFGFGLASDKRGITQVSSALATIGYAAALDENSSLRFGLSVGYGYNSVDLSSVGNINDPVLANLMTKNSFLIGNAGLSFQHKTFNIGAAMPNIFQSIYLSKDAFTITALKPFQALIIHASNRFYFNNDQNVFEPYLIYRLNGPLPSQLEAAAVVHLQHAVWVGASYKQQFGISGLMGFKIKNQFAVGFSYSIKNGGLNQIPAPSYELQLGYLAGNRKKDSNAYSFVNTEKEKRHRKTAAQIASERKKQQAILENKLADDKKKQEALLAKQKSQTKPTIQTPAANTATQITKSDKQPASAQTINPAVKIEEKQAVQAVNQPAIKETDKVPQKTEERRDTTHGGARFKTRTDLMVVVEVGKDAQHLEEQEKLKRLETHAADPDEEHNNEVVHLHAERHEFAKKGAHQEELDFGTYVIAGVFRSRDNAENFSKGLSKMSFRANFGFLTTKNLWYVYIFKTDEIESAKAARDKFRKMKIFRDSWLMTVHDGTNIK